MLLIIKSSKKKKTFFLAVEKAFDNLEWTFNFMTLKNHYPKNFLTRIQTIYKEQEDKIMKNSFVLQRSTVMKGKIQGCAFSPFLYLLSLEALIKKIRKEFQELI